MAIPVMVSYYMNDMKADLKNNYGVNVTKFFYGGHSLGGSTAASWVHDNSDDVLGAFALGAYVSIKIKDPALNYKVPFLTVGAELDGWMARTTRIAVSYD